MVYRSNNSKATWGTGASYKKARTKRTFKKCINPLSQSRRQYGAQSSVISFFSVWPEKWQHGHTGDQAVLDLNHTVPTHNTTDYSVTCLNELLPNTKTPITLTVTFSGTWFVWNNRNDLFRSWGPWRCLHWSPWLQGRRPSRVYGYHRCII